jgi:hypothetical protein
LKWGSKLDFEERIGPAFGLNHVAISAIEDRLSYYPKGD